jgi:Holliday junction resolvase RusA-like endonuclease
MTELQFVVLMEPRGKGRPRFTSKGRPYTDPKTVQAERQVRFAAKQAMGAQEPMQGPLALRVDAVFTHPPSWSKRQCAAVLKTSKPDLDNVVKLAKDAMNGVVWTDDAQVCASTETKSYGTRAALVVTVRPATLDDWEMT